MKIQSVFVLFAIFGMLMLVSSQNDGQIYCGRRLATALDFFCEGNLIKRSQQQDVHAQDADITGPWITAHRAHSMGRSKRQVVAECCDKPCSVDELMTYCGN